MNNIHSSNVHRYLLGQLSGEEAQAFEEAYLADGSLLDEIETAEAGLIVDFIRGRLSPGDHTLFARRCNQLPDLRRRVDDCRRELGVPRSNAGPATWMAALAAVLILGIAVGIISYRRAPKQQTALGVPPGGQKPRITLRLRPGVSMGSRSQAAVATLPAHGILDLVLELPDSVSAADLAVSISRVDADGRLVPTWTSSKPVPVTASGDGARLLRTDIDTSLIPPGTYEVQAGDGGVGKTWLFDVVRAG